MKNGKSTYTEKTNDPMRLVDSRMPESESEDIGSGAYRVDKTPEQVKAFYEQGIKYYREGNPGLAEQEFVKVLKPVLGRPGVQSPDIDIKDVATEALSAMYHLGLIYLNNGNYFENHAKAAGIFQYCAGFAEKRNAVIKLESGEMVGKDYFLKQAYSVEASFLSSISKSSSSPASTADVDTIQKDITTYKNDLKAIRDRAEKGINGIKNEPIELIAERAAKVESIYKECNELFVNGTDKEQNPGLVQKLISRCIKQLGPAPEGCEYSFISLGSLAGGRMTPWSDLEFAILINEDKPEFKEYFRNLTKLLHIKMINLGETPLRSIGIELLNNFRTGNKQDDWFWDDILESGFSFDGPDWHACKTPLGRQGKYKAIKEIRNKDGKKYTQTQDKNDFELILTPKLMACFQQENHFDSDKHLVQALRSVSLIEGSQALLDEYRDNMKGPDSVMKKKATEILREDIGHFALRLGDGEEGKLFNVKKDIFRIGERIIEALANYYDIWPEVKQPGLNIWEIIDKMAHARLISPEGVQHLKEAISIAMELRLATYCHNKGQKESFATYEPALEHLSEQQKKPLQKETFYTKNLDLLYRFYYTIMPLQEWAGEFCSKEKHPKIEEFLKKTQLRPAEAGGLMSRLEVAVTLKRYYRDCLFDVRRNGYRCNY